MDKDTIVVGRWAEFHKDHPQVSRLKAQMTMKNPEYEKNERLGFPNVIMKYDKEGNVVGREEVPKIIQLFHQVGDRVLFPRAVVHPLMGKQGVHIVDRTTTGERVEFPSLIKLRPYQEPFVDKLEAALRSQYGAVGQAEAGFGKTVCSLELMSRLGLKTVILVHKEFLMTQWIHRMLGTKAAAHFLGVRPSELSDKIEPPMLGIEPEDIGIVLQGRCEWEDKKVVVAMVQSLTSGREYPKEFYESFGLVLVDEVHRFSAPVFRQSIVKFPAAKRLGVTATPERNDGLESVFFAHIGQIAAVGKGDRAKPRVNRIQTPVRATPAIHRKMKVRGRENLSRIINFLVDYDARNRQIVRLLVKAAENGRKILVLSHRVAHVEELRRQFIEACRTKGLPVSTAYYIGGMDLKERANAEKMQVLFATYQLAKEGLDIPALDTIFLTTPVGDVEQAVGRILRKHSEKMTPVVVDFVDTAFKMTTGLANKRKRAYEAKGWLN